MKTTKTKEVKTSKKGDKKKAKKATAKKKGKPGRKLMYGKVKLTKMFNMKVTATEQATIRKNGGAPWVRKRLGLSTGV